MINLQLLEQKWLNYKFKKILILNMFIILSILIILILYLYLFLFEKKFLDTLKVKANQIFFSNKVKKIEDPIKIELLKKEKAKIRLLLEEEMREKIIASTNNSNKIRKPYTPSKNEEDKKKNFTIKINSKNFLFHMKKRFKKDKDPHIALSIANFYFNKKNYRNAKYWALTSNKIDRGLEKSWIIFAKSQVKLGRKKEALRILNSYYQNSPSKAILQLISKIRNNN